MEIENVMALDSVESSPAQVPRQASSEPCGPRRDSTEDADASLTRKRPRLADTEEDSRTQSADPASTAAGELNSSSPRHKSKETTESSPTRPSALPMNRSSSKVTINVRQSQIPSEEEHARGSQDLKVDAMDDANLQVSQQAAQSIPQTPSSSPPAQHIEAVSPSPSPPGSPEIEVADVEDMDGDHVDSRWTQLIPGDDGIEALLEAFPSPGNTRITLDAGPHNLYLLFEKAGEIKFSILEEFGAWLHLCVQHIQKNPRRWSYTIRHHAEFWHYVSRAMDALMLRRHGFPQSVGFRGSSPVEEHTVDQLFQDFAILVPLYVQMDIVTLEQYRPETQSDLKFVSLYCLRAFRALLTPQSSFWLATRDDFQFEDEDMIDVIGGLFSLEDPTNLSRLQHFSDLLFANVQFSSNIRYGLEYVIGIIRSLVAVANRQIDHSQTEYSEELDDAYLIVRQKAVAFFLTADRNLRAMVDRQASALSREFSESIVKEMTGLAYALGEYNPGLVKELTESFMSPNADLFNSEDASQFIRQAWKFSIFQKFIVSGRMEVRSIGVSGLSDQLVAVHKEYSNISGPPVPQYLASLIVDCKLVEYIVGPGSHPELMPMSANIIGFLVVTGRYRKVETDTIWERVITSQDPRIVAAIVEMVQGISHLMDYETLLYVCEKLEKVPLNNFDGILQDFSRDILEKTRLKFRDISDTRDLDAPPYKLCIRLIREAAAGMAVQADKRAIYDIAMRELKTLMGWGPADSVRIMILKDCIRDIQERTSGATGSISAISVLVGNDVAQNDDLMVLSENGTIELIIEEFATTVDNQKSQAWLGPEPNSSINIRLQLIGHILARLPDSIPPSLGRRLWDYLVGKSAYSMQERELAWNVLCDVIRHTGTSSSFIEDCVNTYLGELESEFYNPGVLSFVQQVVEHLGRLEYSTITADYQIVEIPGIEHVWDVFFKSPSHMVENGVIQYLVQVYLDMRVTREGPRSAAEATQVALVNRCVSQLKRAADKLPGLKDAEKDSIALRKNDKPTNEQMAERLQFSRSLLFLREFLRGLKARPLYSPQRHVYASIPPAVSEDNLLTVRFQVFRANHATEIQEFSIAEGATLNELQSIIGQTCGLSSFSVIVAGRMVDLDSDPMDTIASIKLDLSPWIIVRQKFRIGEIVNDETLEGLSVSELELMKHFNNLYEFLNLDEDLASEVWQLLSTFSPQKQIRQMVLDPNIDSALVFPMNYPFKIIYSTYTLRSCLEDQLRKGLINEDLLVRGIQILVSALSTINLSQLNFSPALKIGVGSHLANCLMRFLKEPVSNETSNAYFSSEEVLVNNLVDLIVATNQLEFGTLPSAGSLSILAFAVILEASLHSPRIWEVLKLQEKVPSLIRSMLLEDFRPQVRSGIGRFICNYCKPLPGTPKVGPDAFSKFFWKVLYDVISETPTFSTDRSQEFFETAVEVFRAHSHYSPSELELDKYLSLWGDALINQSNAEFVGRENINHPIMGLTKLLVWCLQSSKSLKKQLVIGDLAERVFNKHMFPELSALPEDTNIHEQTPVLHTGTRKEIYNLILLSTQDLTKYEAMIDLVAELVPHDVGYLLPWNFERAKAIRSNTGYVGLRNLSNTCYLNSLFTQLYMNTEFRGFMLNANVADANGSQKLLRETKILFTYMQDSFEKAVEPRAVAEAIRTYENEIIDVNIQMDVDEFYNLLFDRWEGQMLSPEAKQTFRSFYGGQLVQQVKSKECDHISEREEPFSAIQCDIKGKSDLEASLKAYVEGENMEGDNKYSCTSCGRHVDAVKRTCLKDVPDNLIFHLKRFDFDLRTMQRNKINDQFDFPYTVDMKPYKIDHLSSPSTETPEDLFELVGVLVHSGTAESGHYYSFIKERNPDAPTPTSTWVEFNDADVQYFDPSLIPVYTFGGNEEWRQNGNGPKMYFPKTYSAYMLFYQRIRKEQFRADKALSAPVNGPKKMPPPIEMRNHVALDNEMLLRRYCLYDPAHVPFVKSMLDLRGHLSKSGCSDNHNIETKAIQLALDHVDQIISKTKDVPDFDAMMISISRVIGSCTECCAIALDWIGRRPDAMRNLLLRCPVIKVRQDFTRLVLTAMKYLRMQDAARYGIEIVSTAPIEFTETNGALQSIVKKLRTLYMQAMETSIKAWDEYFGLLSDIANFGLPEASILLRSHFLTFPLQALILEASPHLRSEYEKLYKQLLKGRKPSYNKMIELVYTLLKFTDLTLEAVPNDALRAKCRGDDRYPLTIAEETVLTMRNGKQRTLVFVSKILDLDQNVGVAKAIVGILCSAEPEFNQLPTLQRTLTAGISIDPASLAGPYLQAAIAFCENAPNQREINELISQTSKDVATIGTAGGREHYLFFRMLLTAQNDRLPSSEMFFRDRLLRHSEYWAPTLLLYWEPEVRLETEELLNDIFFKSGMPPNTDNMELDALIMRTGQQCANACIALLSSKYIDQRSPAPSKTLESILRVMEKCQAFFEFNGDESFGARRETVVDALQHLVVDEDIEENVSEEWDNDSVMASDSSEIDPLSLPNA